MKLDRLCEKQPEDRGRKKRDREVDGETLRVSRAIRRDGGYDSGRRDGREGPRAPELRRAAFGGFQARVDGDYWGAGPTRSRSASRKHSR